MPQNISKLCILFLNVPNTYITAEVIGKRLSRGGGYGLEIPVSVPLAWRRKSSKLGCKEAQSYAKPIDCQASKCVK